MLPPDMIGLTKKDYDDTIFRDLFSLDIERNGETESKFLNCIWIYEKIISK